MRMLLAFAALLAGSSQGANAGDAECIFQMGGKDVLVGPCQASEGAASGGVEIGSLDGTIAARVVSSGGGVGEAFWNEATAGKAAEVKIGTVVLIGTCWASDKSKLCVAN